MYANLNGGHRLIPLSCSSADMSRWKSHFHRDVAESPARNDAAHHELYYTGNESSDRKGRGHSSKRKIVSSENENSAKTKDSFGWPMKSRNGHHDPIKRGMVPLHIEAFSLQIPYGFGRYCFLPRPGRKRWGRLQSHYGVEIALSRLSERDNGMFNYIHSFHDKAIDADTNKVLRDSGSHMVSCSRY